MTKKILISLSGGMDSATVLGVVRQKLNHRQVACVSFAYPSKHNPYELLAAERLAKKYQCDHHLIKLDSVFEDFTSNLLKSGGDIPEGHYADESMKQTVVPARNLIFGSILAGFAESNGFCRITLGIHAGDHAIYPDCRPDFFESFNKTVQLATDGKVEVDAPFLFMNKAEILQLGSSISVPYEYTRTCYKNQPVACGKCGSCRERLEAFAALRKRDPLEYEED